MAREKGMGNLQREKSGRWTMRVSIKGKRYCRSTRTKDRDKAERILQRFLAPFGLGEHRLPLADVWLEYVRSPLRNELAQSTLNCKRIVWMHFASWMERFYLPIKDLSGVTSEMVAEYLECLRAGLCASTYNGRVCVLREIFHVLAKKAGLEEDVWEGVRLRPDDSHSRRELTMDELRRLLDAAKNVGGEWHKLILIGIYTGLRLGDCCMLDWSQINIAQGVIQLMPRKTRRHHQRMVTIPVHPALGEALLASKPKPVAEVEQRTTSSFLVRRPEHEANDHCSTSTMNFDLRTGPVLPMVSELYRSSRSRVGYQLSKIFRSASIESSIRLSGRKRLAPEATFHSLRHTFVSFAANAGVPLHIVQSIVGHESTAMTRHYYHENLAALKSAVAAIPTL